ncbi:MAG: alpha/beta hydrolase [Pseudomonadota bacterium]|nr:alpha/beta hydrolase [Pseudomonadota bacterium]
MNRTEGTFRGYDGTELFFQTWDVDSPKGTILVTHGLAEHSECYNRLAEGLAPFNWSLIGWDLRGHGRSEGKRGYVKHFGEFSKDLNELVNHLKTKVKVHEPLFLLGHSTGGLISIQAVIDFGDMGTRALSLSSPLLGIALAVPQFKDMAAKLIHRFIPSLTLNNEIIYEHLTHDEQIYRSYASDPLRHDRISISLYLSMIETMDYAMLHASKIQMPLLTQLAGEDLITSVKASERFFERVGSQRKDLKLYKDYYHEIFNEVGRPLVYSDLNHFLSGFLEKI